MLKEWPKIKEKKLFRKFGKELKRVMFLNPATNQEEEFILFGQEDASMVMPVTEDNQVVTVLQFKQGCNKIIQELPAGAAIFKEESPEETAKRELLEETGYQCGKIIFLGPPLWIVSRWSWTRFFPFLATGCKKVREAECDALEKIEVELIPLKKWVSMTLNKIEEPSSVVTTFRALPHLKTSIFD